MLRDRDLGSLGKRLNRVFATLLISSAFFFLGAVDPPRADAYCCWNKAICEAVCGNACCGGSSLTSKPKNEEALSKMSVRQLKAEAGKAKGGDALARLLDSSIKQRTRLKAR